MPNHSQTVDERPILVAQVDTPQDETTGDFYYRTYAPGVAMAQCEGVYVINLTNIHRKKEEVMRVADVLVLNNLCDPDLLPIIRERKQRGKSTVYELCDDLDAVPPGSPVYPFYNDPENRLLIKKLAHYCDAMQFSSPELQRKYGFLNGKSEVFPNQILEVPPERRYSRRPEVIVGWGGSLGHLDDMARLSQPLIGWIMSRNDVSLHLMCADPIWKLFDRLPPERKRWIRTGSLKDYYRFLSSIDIGLAPLEDTPFNRSRSDIKFLEYAAHGVVPVVQASGPYLSVVKNGVSGLLFNTTEELVRILDGLVRDLSMRTRMSIAARDYILRERLQIDHGRDRIGYYLSMLPQSGPGLTRPNHATRKFQDLAKISGAERRGNHLLLASTRFELLVRGGLLASDLSSPLKASSMFREAIQLEPWSYLPRMFGAYFCGDVIQSFREAIVRNPLSIKSRVLLGEEYAKRGDVIKALECFKAAAETFPEYELPYLKAAALLKDSGFNRQGASLVDHARNLICRKSIDKSP